MTLSKQIADELAPLIRAGVPAAEAIDIVFGVGVRQAVLERILNEVPTCLSTAH